VTTDSTVSTQVVAPSGAPSLRGRRYRDAILRATGTTGFLVALVIYFSIAAANFGTGSTVKVILTQASVIGIISLGQLFAILAGGFDLSVGGAVPLAGVVFVTFANKGIPAFWVIVSVLALVALLGVANGLLVTLVKVNPLVTTLGTLSVAQGLAYTVTQGNTVGLSNPSYAFIGDTGPFGLPYFAYLFLGLAIVFAAILRYSVYGRQVYAVGGSREASRLAGLKSNWIIISGYMIASVLAAVAGIVLASQLLAGSPNSGSDSSLNSIAAVVLGGAALTGGAGGVGGTIIGVLILGTLSHGLNLLHVQTFYQQIATGVALLIAVIVNRLVK
jgi:ribose transport system permease protein